MIQNKPSPLLEVLLYHVMNISVSLNIVKCLPVWQVVTMGLTTVGSQEWGVGEDRVWYDSLLQRAEAPENHIAPIS